MTAQVNRPDAPLTIAPEHLQWMQRLVLLVFFLVVVRGLLPPNSFSATVLLFDYEFGLIRRGLMGTIANFWWKETVTRSEVYAVSAAMSFFGLATLYALVARVWLGSLPGALLGLILFGSAAFGGLVAATGYLDLVLIGLVCLSMLTDPARLTGVLARVLAIGLGMLFHEIALGYFAIVMAADIWLRRGRRLWEIPVALLPFLAGVGVLLLLAAAGNLPKDQIPAFLDYIAAKAGFTPDPEATVVIERHLSDNLTVMESKRTETGYRAWAVMDGVPLLIMSIWTGWLVCRGIGPGLSGRRGLDKLVSLGAIAAPLSLNVIAFDVVRFGVISVLCGFFVLMSLWRDAGARGRIAAALTLPGALMVLVLNLLTGVTQMGDGELHFWQLPWVFIEHLSWL